MRPYVIRQGEYLSQLAARLGFNAEDIWQHADNEELRGRRDSGDMLAPGDILHIPDDASESVSIVANSHNRYRGRVPTIPIEIACSLAGEPLANASCTIEGLPQPETAQSDGDGVVRFNVPTTCDEAWIVFEEQNARFRVLVGHLDPHQEQSGVMQRLVNLGYGSDEHLQSSEDARASWFRNALQAFQRDRDLDESGELTDETRSALVDAHGS